MSIFAVLAPYKLGAEVVVFGALAVGVLWGAHAFLEHERDLGRQEVQALWDKENNDRAAAAVKLTADQNAARELAVKQGEDRDKTINAAVAVSAAAVVGMRNATTSLQSQLSTASVETARRYAAAASTVSTECGERYSAMADAAAKRDSAARTLDAAWPTLRASPLP